MRGAIPEVEAPGEPRDALDAVPPMMECIVVHDGDRYYANSEGYDYPRYLLQIVNRPAR